MEDRYSSEKKYESVECCRIGMLKNLCFGCGSCFNICPAGCIKMAYNDEGFLYPAVDHNKCIHCMKCEKACPVLHKQKNNSTERLLAAYCGWHTDERTRLLSTSGGVYSALAETIFRHNGVVFGAEYDTETGSIRHKCAGSAGLERHRKPKYAESNTNITFPEVKSYLDKGVKVLYSGTPCQIAGLKLFLQKEYSNLITCDFICHGVPSAGLLKQYLSILEKKYRSGVSHIDFRPKLFGWSRHMCLKIQFANGREYIRYKNSDPYFRGFGYGVTLRSSCYSCPFRSEQRVSDVTLADFWGVFGYKPEINDEKGISLVILNTEKGVEIFEEAKDSMQMHKLCRDDIAYCFKKKGVSRELLDKRNLFFNELKKNGFTAAANKYIFADGFTGALKRRTKDVMTSLLYFHYRRAKGKNETHQKTIEQRHQSPTS